MRKDWTLDEIILVLNLYLQRRCVPEKDDKDIVELKSILQRRSISSVYLKLANIASLDPSYPYYGMQNVSANDRLIWNSFGSRPADTQRLAASIRSLLSFTL
jgi:hypothetical protein